MNQTIKLSAREVPANLRKIDGYSGRTFRMESTLSVEIPADAGLSSGGTIERFFYLRLADGAIVRADGASLAPWSVERRANTVTLAPGFAIVERSFFCGKDCGLRFYVHPENVARFLTAGVTI